MPIRVSEPALLASMQEFGKPPRAVLSIHVSEADFHCGKALMRSRLWSADAQVERSVFPSIGEVIHDQTALGEPAPEAVVGGAVQVPVVTQRACGRSRCGAVSGWKI